ncbi:MAG: hypothetical protein Kow00121_58360 [Elainellaceae cyanobacterium]
MKEITDDLMQQLLQFTELPIPDDRLPKVQAELTAAAGWLALLDHLDLSEVEPVTHFSAAWEDA